MLKKLTLLLAPLVLASGLGWYFRTESDFFLVRDLSIEVELAEEQEALMTQLKRNLTKPLEGLKGKNIWTLGLGNIRAQLLENPWVAEVELSRQFPGSIHTLIRMHSVSLLYVDKRNQIYPILENGEKMEVVRTTMAPVAPILRNNKILNNPEKLKTVLQLMSEIPSIGPLKRANIASVNWMNERGLTLQLIKQKALVHLGDKEIQTKALQVLRVIDYLQSQKQKARVIDASFTKKVLVRPRKRS